MKGGKAIKTKKIITMLLTFCMILSVVSPVFAEANTDEQANMSEQEITNLEENEEEKEESVLKEDSVLTQENEEDSVQLEKEELYMTDPQVTYNITFVKKDGSEETVNFTDPSSKIGLNGTPAQSGSLWIFKSYFIGWSDNKDYLSNRQGNLFYDFELVSDLQNAGIENGTKLYAMYASISIAYQLKNNNKLTINNDVSGQQFVTAENPIAPENIEKLDNKTTVVYNKEDGDYKITTLKAHFDIDPFVAAAVYKDPWTGALENGSTWEALSKKLDPGQGTITVVDLHVSIDKRITLPETFDINFNSYTFRPISAYSEMKADGTPVQNYEPYPYIAVDQATDKPKHGVLARIKDNDPSTTFTVKSYVLDDNGEKVPIHDFVIRTRTRVGYDSDTKKIFPVTMEQVQSGMQLSLAGGEFKVDNSLAADIAAGKEEALKIGGFVDGKIKKSYFGPISPELGDEILDFKAGEVSEEALNVTFINDNDIYAQVKVGKGENLLNNSIKNQSMPQAPTKEGYHFLGWNTEADGSGQTFTEETVVNADMKVYAQWEKDKPVTPNKPDRPDKSHSAIDWKNLPEASKEDIHMAYLFGYPDMTIRAEGNMTRAEAVAVLVRLEGFRIANNAPTVFADCLADGWYNKYINAAYNEGILEEKAGENFRPDDKITRAELAKLYSHVDKKLTDDRQADLNDIKGHKYEKEIVQVYSHGIIEGYPDKSFKPDAAITRAEMATMTNRLYQRKADLNSFKNLKGLKDFPDLDSNYWAYSELMEASNGHSYIRRNLVDDKLVEDWISIIGNSTR